jgi:glyoxylase-like metal-dependent hydrolase (beta-lactamase superfamily II)/ferredoxin
VAREALRRSGNAVGRFFVDSTCIDCDTCRWIAPEVFARQGGRSVVSLQPESGSPTELRALHALVCCPVQAIGAPGLEEAAQAVAKDYPLNIDEDVYHCGFHSPRSYGGTSYLVQRSSGNVMVDSPRFSPELAERLRALGGVRYLFLTHRDDIADHARWRQEFECDRLLHLAEVEDETRDVEIILEGATPVHVISESGEFLAIPVPGHTRGHTALLYRGRFLFSGDHLAWMPSLGHLGAFRQLCWDSWPEQIKSQQELMSYQFEWVLPAHGRRFFAPAAEMREHLQQCIDWMKRVA